MFRTAYTCRFLLVWMFVLSACVIFLALPLTVSAQASASTAAGGSLVSSILGGLYNAGSSAVGQAAVGSVDWLLSWIVLPISWLMMQIVGFFFGIVAALFDFAVVQTITQFGTFYTSIKEPVEGVWSSLRDLANIAIIGAFVFVAISTILGAQAFGYQKFLARLIIVAVLINFSLFFSKLAIDVSHVFANQFYDAMSISQPAAAGAATSVNGTQVASTGIAGAFTKTIGLTSWLGDATLLSEAYKQGGSFRMFVFALASSALLLFASLVFAYAVFLLLSRGAMLIFLIMLSGLAFATLAIPKLDNWWTKWYRAFLNNLFFAPLFMAMLWASLAVSQKMASATTGQAGANLSTLATSPAGSAGIIFNYLIIIGLLIGSIQIAKSLSVYGAKSIPDWGKLAKFGGYQLPGRIIGAAGQGTLGLGASGLLRLGRVQKGLDGLASSENFFTRNLGLGLKSTLTGARTGSFNPARGFDQIQNKLDKLSKNSLGPGPAGGIKAYEDSLRNSVSSFNASGDKVNETFAKQVEEFGKLGNESSLRDAKRELSKAKPNEDVVGAAYLTEVAQKMKVASGKEAAELQEAAAMKAAADAVQSEKSSASEKEAAWGRLTTQLGVRKEDVNIEEAAKKINKTFSDAVNVMKQKVDVAKQTNPIEYAKAHEKSTTATKKLTESLMEVKAFEELKAKNHRGGNETKTRADLAKVREQLKRETQKRLKQEDNKDFAKIFNKDDGKK